MPAESRSKTEPVFENDEEANLHQPRNLKEKFFIF